MQRGRTDVRLACRARIAGAVSIRPIIYNALPDSTPALAGRDGSGLVAGVDLGTTSIAAAIIDPSNGLELGRSSVPNPQATFGADVLARLSAALEGRAGELRELAVQGILNALRSATDAAGVSLDRVERLAIAGNTAMAALLVGADVATLAVHPFTPPEMGRALPAESELRYCLAGDADAVVVPAIASFVGGDALAATLSAGMIEAAEPMLLVDFGTNAEIVLAGAGALVVASAAAGPAFEGVGVSCGGPAVDGAVTRVRIAQDGSVMLDSIGSGAPQWFSGSGLVSAVAELRRHGHLDASGLLCADGPLSARFARSEGGVLAVGLGEDESGCLVLTQLDVRALQLAKAAVRVGIEAVLSEGGVAAADLGSVLVAGAFGSALEPADLIGLGILPVGVAEKTHRVGNASLEGAAVIALDPGIIELALTTASAAVHVDLALDPGFARALVAATEFVTYSS